MGLGTLNSSIHKMGQPSHAGQIQGIYIHYRENKTLKQKSIILIFPLWLVELFNTVTL